MKKENFMEIGAKNSELSKTISQMGRMSKKINKAFLINQHLLENPPDNIVTRDIVITRLLHSFDPGGYTSAINIYAFKKCFVDIGVLIISQILLACRNKIIIRINNKQSDIRNLIIDFCPRTPSIGDDIELANINYHPLEVKKFPFNDLERKEFPLFFLKRHLGEDIEKLDDVLSADTVLIMGSVTAGVSLGQLFFDIGAAKQKCDEFHLPTAPKRGFEPDTLEINIWLPGSFGWRDDYFDDR